MDERIGQLLDFWFEPAPRTKAELDQSFARWFEASEDMDAELAERFGTLASSAAQGELDDWRHDARGRLALILLLDQLPRNLHRGTAEAFAQDAKALALTREGIDIGMDRQLPIPQRCFFYMPLQHAEDLDAQRLGVRVFEAVRDDPDAPALYGATLASMADYARLHHDIVAQFGRFPHRNRALGREHTEAELAYMERGGPSFGQ